MSLLDALRSGIRTANKVTRPLQGDVTYTRVNTRAGDGAVTSAASPTTLKALVEFKAIPVRNKEGVTTMTWAVLDLLDIAAIVAATNGAGVSSDDLFTLPDGRTGKVISVGGFVDAGTTHPIATTMMLG